MKTALKPALTAAKRLFLRYQMWSLELQIFGAGETLPLISCPMTKSRAEIARHNARISLAVLRAEYNATFPAGQRRTWRLA